MPSHTITTAMYQPFQTTGTITIRVTVAAVDYNPTWAAGWYRHYLANASASGADHQNAKQALAYLQTQFNAAVAGWTVRMRANGMVEMTNSAGTWSVSWTTADANGAIIRNLFGWEGNIASTAANTYDAGDYHPTHSVYLINRSEDRGWQPEFSGVAAAKMPTGVGYEFNSGTVMRAREFNSQFHSYDVASLVALGYTATDGAASVIEGPQARWRNPSATMTTGFSLPWSVADTVFTAGGRELGCAFGNFQDHVSGTTTTYDKCYLDSSTRKAMRLALTQKNWSRARDVTGWKLSWDQTATRS